MSYCLRRVGRPCALPVEQVISRKGETVLDLDLFRER